MRTFSFSTAAETALARFLTPARPRARKPAPEPSWTVSTPSGAVADASTVTGVFRALHALRPADRDAARVYDDNGWCCYR